MTQSLFRLFADFGVPVLLTSVFTALVLSSDAHGAAVGVAILAFVIVMGLWFLFRSLVVHASAARLLGGGQTSELIQLAERKLDQARTRRGRQPFRVYLAWGHILGGHWDRAARVLDEVGAVKTVRRSWELLWASAAVTVRVERGDAAGARALYQDVIAAFARRVPSPGIRLVADEAEGKVRFVEGDHAGTLAIFQRQAGDVRLGPATRAFAHWYAGRAALAMGDRAAADRHLDEASRLGPMTFLPRSAAELRSVPAA